MRPIHFNSKSVRNFSLSILSLLFLSASAVHADLLASWDNWTNSSGANADSTASGFTAVMTNSGTQTTNATFGSDDGTFGDDVAGAVTAAGGLLINDNAGNDTLTFTLTNTSGQDYSIGSLHFDFAPRQNGNEIAHGYNAFVLSYVSGGLGPVSTEIDTQTGLSNVILDGTINRHSDYPGYDYNLSSSLTDTTLGNGESAVFSIVFSGQTPDEVNGEGKYTSSVFDNVAFQGSVIPEPSSLLLLLVSGLGFICLRHRKR